MNAEEIGVDNVLVLVRTVKHLTFYQQTLQLTLSLRPR